MNILSTARKTISLFLVFILTEGTTTAFFPSSSSFITEVRALSDYEMMMGESKSQYLPYKKDDIKCNNFNLNANGLNVNAIPKPLSALRAAQAQAEDGDIGTSTFGNDEKRFGSDNKDFAFKCVNNKDNELIRSPTPTPTPIDFLDLVTANELSNDVSILLGNGDGTFGPHDDYLTGSSLPRIVATGDFDNDTELDLVVIFPNNNIAILLGGPKVPFLFPNSIALVNPTNVAVADLNKDGDLDLAVSTQGTGFNQVSIFLGNGNGTFGPANPFPVGDNPFSVAVGDFNEDNDLDLVTANLGSQNISILLGDGIGSFGPPNNFPVGSFSPIFVAIGDFNNDQDLDLVTANQIASSNQVSILLGNGNGTFDTATTLSTGTGTFTSAVAVGDFNEDGDLDIAAANIGTHDVSIFLGNGNGTFGPANNVPVGGFTPIYVVTTDFNGDDNLDLVTANANSDNVSILLGNGNGTFDTATTFATGDQPLSVAVGNFN